MPDDEMVPEGSDDTGNGADAGDEPDLEDEDLAEIPDDVVAEVAEETATDGADDQDSEDADDSASDDGMPSPAATTGTTDDDLTNSVGDLYCNALAVGAVEGRDRRGSLDQDRTEAVDHYKGLAKELELDDYMNQWWVENMGGSGEVSPGQGLLAYTSMFAVFVIADDPDLVDGALEDLDDLGGGDDS